MVQLSKRPNLVVELIGTKQLDVNYEACHYRVVSWMPMNKENLKALVKTGIIAEGQEFIIHSQCDGKESPQCEEVSREGLPPLKVQYYVYNIETRLRD